MSEQFEIGDKVQFEIGDTVQWDSYIPGYIYKGVIIGFIGRHYDDSYRAYVVPFQKPDRSFPSTQRIEDLTKIGQLTIEEMLTHRISYVREHALKLYEATNA